MTDWHTCPAVDRRTGKLSGAWTFAGTRVPVSALFENLGSGATVEQFLDWFPGVEEWKVRAVLEHEAERSDSEDRAKARADSRARLSDIEDGACCNKALRAVERVARKAGTERGGFVRFRGSRDFA